MALLVWDGFDHYAAAADVNARSGFLQYQASGSLLAGAGRNGNGKAWNGSLTATFGQRVASAFIGVSADMTSGDDVTFEFFDSTTATVQVTVVLRARNCTIELWRGAQSTLLYRSANNVWGANVYNFLELWPVIDNASGALQLQINNQLIVNQSGLDTQNSANAWWDQVAMTGAKWDDFYYADTTTGPGSNPCSSFLGDPRVYTQFPTADAAVLFTPKAGTNWQEVSETAMDGDTSYNASANVTDEDLFAIGAVPTTIRGILGLQITGAYRKDDAGLRKMKSALKSGVTEVYGTANFLADGSYNYFTDKWMQDPHTSADWTRTGINAANVGYNVAA